MGFNSGLKGLSVSDFATLKNRVTPDPFEEMQ